MSLPEIIGIVARLTPRRLWNLAAVLSSYALTRWLRRPIQWGLPVTISIEPTTACNLRCPECPSGLRAFTRATGNLRADFFRRTVDDLHRDLMVMIFYFQGEPFIHPQFLDLVRYARSRGLYTITSTNGHFFDDETARQTVESGLDRLIISIDGATQRTYEQYRIGGRLEEVLAGARRLVAWKKRLGKHHPRLVFQMLVVRPNEHEIDDFRRLAREIGVDEVRLKTAQVYDYQQGNPLIPTLERFSRYRPNPDGSWSVKHALANHCWKLWHACVITWDGLVVPCCFDKDASHRMGDLKNSDFRALWQGEAYGRFRSAILQGRDKIDICTNCTEGCRVWG